MNEARFWSNVDWDGPVPAHCPDLGPCAIWTGWNDGRYGGYSRAHGRPAKAHRLASELTDGPIPDGICVLHHCDVTLCVRPSHLFRGTQLDNIADMVAKGRARGKQDQCGERNTNAKLTWAAVDEMRSLRRAGWCRRDLSKRFGVHMVYVSIITTGKAWR